LFLTSASGRIERENDPDRSPGPRFWLAGCAAGNVFGVGAGVPERDAEELLALAATEPPWRAPRDRPRYFERYLALLARGGDVPRSAAGLLYALPHRATDEPAVALVDSESDEGRRLYDTLAREGLPVGLLKLGFRDVSEFWAPWCAALHDGRPASVAFAARLSDAGAEVGVATAVGLRGRGYAAAATARWASLPSLRSRQLFYGTDQENASSQKVAARLGLRLVGPNLRLT
ncbi:MAG TPA: hypothetical protein VFS00_10425, partial [Polyangiaceae bacterium]|nr:hypothetical protein [Polyangiaceae bacterium]